MKKITSIILVTILFFTMIPFSASAAVEGTSIRVTQDACPGGFNPFDGCETLTIQNGLDYFVTDILSIFNPIGGALKSVGEDNYGEAAFGLFAGPVGKMFTKARMSFAVERMHKELSLASKTNFKESFAILQDIQGKSQEADSILGVLEDSEKIDQVQEFADALQSFPKGATKDQLILAIIHGRISNTQYIDNGKTLQTSKNSYFNNDKGKSVDVKSLEKLVSDLNQSVEDTSKLINILLEVENGLDNIKSKDKTPPSPPKADSIADNSTYVKGTGEAYSSVTIIANGQKVGTGQVDAKGNFVVKIPAQKAGTKLSVTLKDFSGNESTAVLLTVKDQTPPSSPKVDRITDKNTYVEGTGEKGSSISIQLNGKEVGTGKVDAMGSFLIKIPVQKAGVKLAVTSKDAAGNVSAPTSITIASSPVITTQTIAAGNEYSLAVRKDGQVYAFGYNQYGQLGDGTTTNRLNPILIPYLRNVMSVDAYKNHSAVITKDGEVFDWGDVYGNQTHHPVLHPTHIDGLHNIVAISTGSSKSIALKADGTVWTWTRTFTFDKNYNETNVQLIVQQVPSLTNIIQISGSDYAGYALSQDGKVYHWGKDINDWNKDIDVPVQMAGLPKIVQISATLWYTLALDNTGAVWMWGDNFAKTNCILNLQDNPNIPDRFSVPTKTWISDMISLSTSGNYAMLEDRHHQLYGMGSNWNGEIGDEVIDPFIYSAPVPSSIHDALSFTTGESHTLVLKEDGTLWAFGSNKEGAMGDGKQWGVFVLAFSEIKGDNQAVPEQVLAVHDILLPKIRDISAPDKPVIDAVTEKDTALTGSTEPGATITVIIGNKQYKTKADPKGHFKVLTGQQKAGSKAIVTATDAAGNVSAATAITVLDQTALPEITISAVTTRSTTVSGKTVAYGSVNLYIAGKYQFSCTTDNNGTFRFDINKQKAGTVIKITGYDKDWNTIRPATVTVK